MENKPSPLEIKMQGAEGETLFWNLKEWLIVEHTEDFQKYLTEMWQHYRNATDERLLALLGALCVEASLDILLGKFIQDYESLKTDTDVTFSLKIKIAEAMCLIPRKILNSCHLVRQVRNEFVHNLEISRLNQLKAKYTNKLKPYVREYNVRDRDWEDWVSLYKDLVGFTVLGLVAYSYQLEALKSYLKTDEFQKHFREHVTSGQNPASDL